MPHANINGVKLNYELHGDSGEPLVLVHGYTGDITDWRHQLPSFAESHRVLIVDNRGHGQSESPPDRSAYTVEQMASDVQVLTRELGLERFHLLGHSMGGAIVQEIALEAPGRLLSLTLHDTADGFANAFMNPVIVAWRDWRFRVAEEQGMAAVAEMNPPFPPPPHMPKERLEETKGRLSRMTVDAFIGAWDGLSNWQGTHQRAQDIGLLTLVIWGDMDSPFIIEGSSRLVKTIPNAEPAIIPECGHSPQWERPPLFNAALAGFLERVSEAAVA
ncbi:MAG TPA: alpha/beta hydrolase [Dehalococcoidia bacterium]|nr:alpha/beta hydrolase [Dehalococcoidia bacterium]